MDQPRIKVVGRGLAEVAVIVVGVMFALAADRWVTAIDERAQESDILEQLIENLLTDSLGFASRVQAAEGRWRLAVELLEGAQESSVDDPQRFVADFERVGWLNPMEYASETWQDLVSTGRLTLVSDETVRRSLSTYYNRIQWLDRNEVHWLNQTQVYQDKARGVLPPLVRLSAMGELPASSHGPAPTMDHVRAVYRNLAENPQLRAELGQVVIAYRGQLRIYPRLEAQLGDLLTLLRGAL